MTLRSTQPCFAVQALGRRGHALGVSATVKRQTKPTVVSPAVRLP